MQHLDAPAFLLIARLQYRFSESSELQDFDDFGAFYDRYDHQVNVVF